MFRAVKSFTAVSVSRVSINCTRTTWRLRVATADARRRAQGAEPVESALSKEATRRRRLKTSHGYDSRNSNPTNRLTYLVAPANCFWSST
jgi:hypothetical protein